MVIWLYGKENRSLINTTFLLCHAALPPHPQDSLRAHYSAARRNASRLLNLLNILLPLFAFPSV